jgi:hypothetical protein
VFKRLFWLVVGFALGIGSSWAVTRRLRRIAQRPSDDLYAAVMTIQTRLCKEHPYS